MGVMGIASLDGSDGGASLDGEKMGSLCLMGVMGSAALDGSDGGASLDGSDGCRFA